MQNYKTYSYEQKIMLPVSLSRQIVPGTFEYTLNYLIDNKLDLSIFHQKYKNDDVGAPAFDPAIMLKIILYTYSRGINSSRGIAALCSENIICIALSADTQPHFTTIADFISSMDNECEKADKINNWLAEHDDKIGAAGKPIKSNITDNESAKMSRCSLS